MCERKPYAPPDITGLITLKVDNVPFRITVEEVKEEFDRFGEVGDVYIPRDRNTGDPRGFAFVRFVNRADADEAMAKMDGAEFKGRQLRIQYAMSRRPDNPREHYQQRAMSSRDAHRGGGGGGGHRRSRSRSPRRRSRSPDRYRQRSRSPDRRDRDRSPDRRRGSPEPRRRSRSP